MKRELALSIIAALGFGAAGAAHADVEFSGFGQVVAGTVTDEDETFPGFGYDDDVSFEEESLFALQARATMGEDFSATAQLVARGHEDFDPEFAWAFVTWDFADDWSLRAGHQRVPYYRYSDFLEVGYAYPWLRVPPSVYNLPFSEYDGVNLMHRTAFGNWFSTTQFVFGRADEDIDGGSVEVKNQWGIAWDGTYNDWLSLRASYFQSDVTIDITQMAPLFATLEQAGLGSLVSRLAATDDRGTFWGLGVEIDRDNVVIGAEFTHTEIDDAYFSETDDYYVSAGYRFGQVMPVVVFGHRDADADLGTIAGIPTDSPLYAPLAGLLQSTVHDDDYVSYGVRWDVATNIALKFDFSQFDSDIAGVGDADLLSVGLAYTF